MTVGVQGTWSVSVRSKSAAWPQRFTIDGAASGDGTYVGATSTPDVLVSGDQWGVTVQHDPSGPTGWRPSRERLADFRIDGGFFKFDIESDDSGGGDEDFNDLVLTLSKPLSDSEWIIYGTAKSYSGFCLFNPCFPFPWVVIDTPLQLERLLRFDEVRPLLERVYGSNVAAKTRSDRFTPLMISRGGSPRTGFAVSGSTTFESSRKKRAVPTVATEAKVLAARATEFAAHASAADLRVLGPLLRRPCESEPIAQALLRVVEYDRTDDELAGQPYTGYGDRETLGIAATDEFGNYVFSFTRSTAGVIEEALGDTPTGGDPVASGRPDVIIQFVDDPDGIAVHETAPYYDVPNVRRIDLCIPVEALVPKPCRGDQVLQYVGDIPIVANPGSTLHSDGTITNTAASESGPTITRGAWFGTVDLIGCFEGAQPQVTHYTIRYQVNSGAWNYLAVGASGLRVQGNGTWQSESWGAVPTALSTGTVPAYRNIEIESGWSLEAEHRKARVTLKSLLAGLPRAVGVVRFQIRGYDASGNYVPNTFHQIPLRVDEESSDGDIGSVLVPGETDLGDCALLELPSDTTPLEFRLRAIDEDGFLSSWSLTAVRGSNTAVGLTDVATSAAPGGSFPGANVDDRYFGTTERSDADVDGYVTISVTPPTSGWLGAEDFCAYSFELHMQDRKTNGKTIAGSRKVWDEVVGMRQPETP